MELTPVTRDQEFLDAILTELKCIKGLLTRLAVADGTIEGVECPVCRMRFGSEPALRAHSRVHKPK